MPTTSELWWICRLTNCCWNKVCSFATTVIASRTTGLRCELKFKWKTAALWLNRLAIRHCNNAATTRLSPCAGYPASILWIAADCFNYFTQQCRLTVCKQIRQECSIAQFTKFKSELSYETTLFIYLFTGCAKKSRSNLKRYTSHTHLEQKESINMAANRTFTDLRMMEISTKIKGRWKTWQNWLNRRNFSQRSFSLFANTREHRGRYLAEEGDRPVAAWENSAAGHSDFRTRWW